MGVGSGGRAVAIPVRRSPATVGFAAQLGAEQLAASGLLHLCSLAFIGVATRALGMDGFGVYRVILQVLTVGALLSHAGLGAQAVRSVALMRATGDHRAARKMAVGAAVAAGALAGLGAVAVYVGAEPLARVLTDRDASDIGALLRLGAAYAPLLAAAEVVRSCTRSGAAGGIGGQVASAVLRFVLGAAALLAGPGLAGAVGTLVVGAAIALAAAWVALRDDLAGGPAPVSPTIPVSKPMSLALRRSGAALVSLPRLAPGIFLLALLGADRDVGLFGVAIALTAVGGILLGVIRPVLEPLALNLVERRDIPRLQAVARNLTGRIAGWAWPFYAGLVLVPEPFVWLLTGHPAPAGATAVAALAAGCLFWVPSAACGRILHAAGLGRVNLLTSALGTALYVGAGMWIVPRFGLVGMAAVHGVVVALQAVARVTEVQVLLGVKVVGSSLLSPFLAAATAGAAVIACRWAGPPGPLTWSAALALFVAVYAVAARAFGRVPVPADIS